MIVIDASAMVEALIGRDAELDLIDALADDVAAPHVLDLEVPSVLRRLSLAGKLEPAAADQARRNHFAFTIDRYGALLLADRIWALRHQYTSYDASYLALAEALDAPLFTCDAKLNAGGHRVHLRTLSRSH